MGLKAAWMDLMPVHTAQSLEFIASVQDANAKRKAAHQQAASVKATPPDLLSMKCSGSTSTARRATKPYQHTPAEAKFTFINGETGNLMLLSSS